MNKKADVNVGICFFLFIFAADFIRNDMKRIFTLIVVALTIAATSVQAQLKLGVTTGLNITNLHIHSDYKDAIKPYADKTKPGFVVGPTAIYSLPISGLSVDVSAMYDLRGMKSKSSNYDSSIKTQSLQIPVNVRYGYEIGDMIHAFIYAGPQFGFCLDSDAQYITTGTNNKGEVVDMQWKPSGSVMSMNIGIGGIVMEKVQVRIGYNIAFNTCGEFQIHNNTTGNEAYRGTGKMHACQIMVSYLF